MSKGPNGYINPTIVEERKMNVAQIDVFSRLMMERIIFIGDAIDDDLANVVIGQLLVLDSASNLPIKIYINSPGGSVYSGLAIYDTIKLLKSEVHTICVGMAASMAAILFLSGKSRKILKHSRVMLHQPSGMAVGTSEDISIVHEEIQKVKRELYNIVEEVTSIDNAEEICRNDKWYTSKESLEVGIATEII